MCYSLLRTERGPNLRRKIIITEKYFFNTRDILKNFPNNNNLLDVSTINPKWN